MSTVQIDQLRAAMQGAIDHAARIAVIRSAAAQVDPIRRPEEFELVATALAVASPSTLQLVDAALAEPELDTEARFLAFAMGAIGCRRANERVRSRELFRAADREFTAIPLFKHLEALSLDQGTQRELRRAVELERAAYAQLRPHGGSAHALASFIAQLVELDGVPANERGSALGEAHDLVAEALQERENYPKFFYTRGVIERQLGRFDAARESILRAVELEDRSSVDAADRLRDYRLQLALVSVDQASRRLNDESRAVLSDLRQRTETIGAQVADTTDRLQNAEVGLITAVAFVASAIALVQVAAGSFGNRPFLEVVAIVASFGVVLFGAVAFGSRTLRAR